MAIESVSQKPRDVQRTEPRTDDRIQAKPKEEPKEPDVREASRQEEDGKKKIAEA